MKPKWKEVPEGYGWMAQDNNGGWFAFQDKPHPIRSEGWWRSPNDGYERLSDRIRSGSAPNWKDTLEKRPGEANCIVGKNISIEMTFDNGVNASFDLNPDRLDFESTYSEWSLSASGKTNQPFAEVIDMNNCPTVKTLEPQERIQGKIDRINAEIEVLADRLGAIDDINCSINWKTATDEIKNKAVEAADCV